MAEHSTYSDELLQALLDGPFKRLRDDNHVDPYSILVCDPAQTPVIQAVEFLDLPALYPCGGPGSQWAPSDFVEILKEKRHQFRKSMASHAISDDDPEITPACGTVVLLISSNPYQGHRWVSVGALIEPGQ
jgi:hypothetical protein